MGRSALVGRRRAVGTVPIHHAPVVEVNRDGGSIGHQQVHGRWVDALTSQGIFSSLTYLVGLRPRQAVEHEIRRLRFLDDMLGNGRTQIYDASNGQLLGRTDPCIPVNIDLGRSAKAIEERIKDLEKLAACRRATSSEDV